ncbi:MAG: hypothetical protein KJ955_02750 [Nanoarchaeota archaeon]|nr:hypothetical protein [Nanoarchaeota archaeon]
MAIEFPGYEPVFENEVYAKDATVIEDGKVTPVKMILIPKRYVEPDEDSVIKHLQARAEQAAERLSFILPGQRMQVESKLEMILLKIGRGQSPLLTHLRTGHEECMAFVRENITAPKLEKGESPDKYLRIEYGMVPTLLIEKNQAAGAIQNAGWYSLALSKFSGINMDLLLADGVIPARVEIERHIANGTYGTRLMKINQPRYSPEEARLIVEATYTALAKPEQIAQVKDSSTEMLNSAAEETLEKMLKPRN